MRSNFIGMQGNPTESFVFDIYGNFMRKRFKLGQQLDEPVSFPCDGRSDIGHGSVGTAAGQYPTTHGKTHFMGSYSAARSTGTSTTKRGRGRHRLRNQRMPVPYAWLGAGAVSLGIGAASFAGSGVAQADDSAAPSSGAGGNESSTERSSSTSTSQSAASDAGTDASSSKPKPHPAAEKPAAKVGDGRNEVANSSTKKRTTACNPADSINDSGEAGGSDGSASSDQVTARETAAATEPPSATVPTSSSGRHRLTTADTLAVTTADTAASGSSVASTVTGVDPDQTSVAQRSIGVAPKKQATPAASEELQRATAVLSNAGGSTAPVSLPEPAPTPSTPAAAELLDGSGSRAQLAADVEAPVAEAIATRSAAIQPVRQQVTAAAAAVADEPVQATLKQFIRTFFNKTPTVSFLPGENTTLQNGTIRGVVRGADADGDVLTYTAGPTANGGTVAISTDGTFIYTPGAEFASKGTDTFLVTASDLAAENGWHVHGLLGLLMPGLGSAASTSVTVSRAVSPSGPTIPTIPTTPTGPTVPTPPNPPGGPPPAGALSAAAAYGWGEPDARLSDEFTGSGAPSTAWNLYRSAGHAGNGLRRPEQITVQDGYLQIAGTSNATSGGMMGSAVNPAFGRWEARMRVDKQGPGNPYHAVVALIPYGVPYNGGAGDLDFAEANVDEGRAYVFIHHPVNKQSYASTTLDLAAWHNYAIEVAPDHISWFVDGKVEMTTTNRAAVTGKQWTANVQLDANSPSGLAPSNMQVDYFRYYPLPPSGAPIIPGAAPNIGNYP